ncbi:sensor histidine kinase [Paenibacillus dendritiformis]|uniref:sensor histidine kinase n=1 Tax=Paenibacillus dendritiformis TaxID=130049 RepID=UPI001F11283F|nr:sensor histidine kinase [Paenibacillus dendritiformis]
MRTIFKYSTVSFMLLMAAFLLYPSLLRAEAEQGELRVTQWQVLWETSAREWKDISSTKEGWTDVDIGEGVPGKPEGAQWAWFRFRLPPLQWDKPGLWIEQVYACEVDVLSEEGRRLFRSSRMFSFDMNPVLIALDRSAEEQVIYIHVKTPFEQLGIHDTVRIGDYQELLPEYVKKGLVNVVMGSALILIAIVMLICTLFLRNIFFSSWLSLCVLILCAGIMIFTYSSFTYTFFIHTEVWSLVIYDFTMLVFFPLLTYYFELMFGPGPYRIIRRLRQFQTAYSMLSLAVLFLNLLADNRFYDMYYFLSVRVLGFLVLIQFVVLISASIRYAFHKDKDAILFCVGFVAFALITGCELIWFLLHPGYYYMVYWKWGILLFVVALIIILGRKIAHNHEQVVQYSKELELYNHRLQRSEKMEIISELAASVAHEVRNPLQVTRGFLQLLEKQSGPKEKEYYHLALTELDRASGIITDFLTFAKPELNELALLNVGEELEHVQGVLLPLANMQGAEITLDVPPDLTIEGNSSKFKQAFINLVKNSIEALHSNGWIRIAAHKQEGQVIIRIRDNGVGMNRKELARLGEPYYSNKTKGTGLGLMVTFRIIEVMQGKLEFHSEKGVGTEVTVTFPAVEKEEN